MSAPSRLIISNFKTGFETDREPFIIDNDAFPSLFNAYIWRGRIQKKRGTKNLGRLERCPIGQVGGMITLINPSPNTFTIDQLLGNSLPGSLLEPNAQFVPGTLAEPIIIMVGGQTLTDNTGTGVMIVAPPGNITAATINYGLGTITISFLAPAGPLQVTFTGCYYPSLPVMGIELFENVSNDILNEITVFLDTKYSYQFNLTVGSRFFYDVSFYKITDLPITWHGLDSQQFWTSNFDNALFATQNVPGLHGVQITSVIRAVNTIINTVQPHGIPAVGSVDWIYIDGVSGLRNPASSPPNLSFINGLAFQINVATIVRIPGTTNAAGLVSVTATVTGANQITLVGYNTTTATEDGSGGFLQEITRQNPFTSTQRDGIHWYDGDPTSTIPPAMFGWVNFAPPLNRVNPDPTIPNVVTFMVGARLLIPFGGAFLALGVWEQSATEVVARFFPQRIRWCTISGTPFYAGADPSTLNAQPLPVEQTSDSLAWVTNVNGRGGFLDIITHEDIVSVNLQQESLILGLENTQRRLATSGSVINPFIPYTINPEYGTQAIFSTIALDRGVLSIGDFGFVLTSSYNCQRFDLRIPDQAFEIKQYISGVPNGPDRICSIRNWQEETVHFSYVDIEFGQIYPNRTVLFNYRDPSFAILKESYTTYGYFKDSLPNDWNGVTDKFRTWEGWLPNWFAYASEPGYPLTTGGNQQGYILEKLFDNVRQDFSLSIAAIGPFVPFATQLTIPNHNLETGDFIFIDNAFGTGFSGVNKQIAKVTAIVNANTITVDTIVPVGVYLGGGEVQVLDNLFVQTKEFAQFWEGAKGLRLGTQRYLLDRTANGEFVSNLYISQDPDNAVNDNLNPAGQPWLPSGNIVRTRPDDSLGIRNSERTQNQIWHRLSNSVLGDGVQIGFSLNDAQMRAVLKDSLGNPSPSITYQDWVLHAIVIDTYRSRILV